MTNGTAEKLAHRAEELPEGSFRRKVLEGAQRFKSAWVELGRLLVEVKRKEHWREWGYPSFERYCTRELFIRASTAEKLTMSFGFLERHEPELVRSRGEARAPPFEVIEVLSRAEAAGRLSPEGWRELRDEVLERPTTAATMSRQLAERFGAPPPPPAPRPPRRRPARRSASRGWRRLPGASPRAAGPRRRSRAPWRSAPRTSRGRSRR